MTLTHFTAEELEARSRAVAADLLARGLMTPEEIAAYQPGGGLNPETGARGWGRCWAWLTLLGKMREPPPPPVLPPSLTFVDDYLAELRVVP